MKKKIYLFPIEQPIGEFYIGKIDTVDLLATSFVRVRTLDNDLGIQRRSDIGRMANISDYLNDPDATFPTSIILSAKSSEVNLEKKESKDGYSIYIMSFDNENNNLFEIIDGQHRVGGLRNNPQSIKELPIVILFDLSQEDKAYIFSVINSNQKQVDKSYIYDLFDVHRYRSPNKLCHELAKTFNSDDNSPFYRRIKMLGKKENKLESLSQGTFVKEISKFITSDSDKDERSIKNGIEFEPRDENKYVLFDLFQRNEDSVIYKILFNYFKAVSYVFEYEWNNPNEFVLSKTTGFGALCKTFSEAFLLGKEQGDLSEKFFIDLFKKTKDYLISKNLKLTASDFGVGEIGQRKLSKCISKSWEV